MPRGRSDIYWQHAIYNFGHYKSVLKCTISANICEKKLKEINETKKHCSFKNFVLSSASVEHCNYVVKHPFVILEVLKHPLVTPRY